VTARYQGRADTTEWVSINTACRILEVSRDFIEARRNDGTLPYEYAGRLVRIRREDLRLLLTPGGPTAPTKRKKHQ
jgi:excisionase family DNA binding protein